jgi:hypothetical protein
MARELKLQSVVILANNFNPSIVRERWIVAHQVFTPAELEGENVYTPAFVQVNGPMSLLAATDRVQFVADPPQDGSDMVRRAKLVVHALPETPYKAVGFNFHWHFRPEMDIATFTHDRFKPPVGHSFGAGTGFGLQAIREINGARESTTIVQGTGDADGVIEVKMNYHYAIGEEDSAKDVVSALDAWQSDWDTANSLCRAILEEPV